MCSKEPIQRSKGLVHVDQQKPPMPDFDEPPVVEVALSVQFDPLAKLGVPQLGLLWTKFRDRFPKVEEHPPLEPAFERFGVRGSPSHGPQLRMSAKPPPVRCWFLNEDGTELVQVQSDRFAHNWRRAGSRETYPRYEHIRQTFKDELDVFRKFLATERLGEFKPNQCEVTYVNHVVSGKSWERHGELGNVLTIFAPKYSDGFLGEPEDARMTVDYVIPSPDGGPFGRLHVSAQPAYRAVDDRAIFIVTLTARGCPGSADLTGVLRALDLEREWVVRGFASITGSKMHTEWGRTDAHR